MFASSYRPLPSLALSHLTLREMHLGRRTIRTTRLRSDFSEVRLEPREDVADEFWKERARIFVTSERVSNPYKIRHVVIFVLYTEVR